MRVRTGIEQLIEVRVRVTVRVRVRVSKIFFSDDPGIELSLTVV